MPCSPCLLDLLWATTVPTTRPSAKNVMKLVLIVPWQLTVAKMQNRLSVNSRAMRLAILIRILANITKACVAWDLTLLSGHSWLARTRRSASLSLSISLWDLLSAPYPKPHPDSKLVSKLSHSLAWTRWATLMNRTNANKTWAVMNMPSWTHRSFIVSSLGPTLSVSVAASTLASRHMAPILLSPRRNEKRKSNRCLDHSSKEILFTLAITSALVRAMARLRRPTSRRWRKIPCSTVRTLRRAFGRVSPMIGPWWTQQRLTTLATSTRSAATSSE